MWHLQTPFHSRTSNKKKGGGEIIFHERDEKTRLYKHSTSARLLVSLFFFLRDPSADPGWKIIIVTEAARQNNETKRETSDGVSSFHCLNYTSRALCSWYSVSSFSSSYSSDLWSETPSCEMEARLKAGQQKKVPFSARLRAKIGRIRLRRNVPPLSSLNPRPKCQGTFLSRWQQRAVMDDCRMMMTTPVFLFVSLREGVRSSRLDATCVCWPRYECGFLFLVFTVAKCVGGQKISPPPSFING